MFYMRSEYSFVFFNHFCNPQPLNESWYKTNFKIPKVSGISRTEYNHNYITLLFIITEKQNFKCTEYRLNFCIPVST